MSHQVAVTQGEGEGQSRVCRVAGTPNAIKGEGQSRVCQVAGTPNARVSEGQSSLMAKRVLLEDYYRLTVYFGSF